MASLTIRGLDDKLLQKLKKLAQQNLRSLNNEILFQLKKITTEENISVEEVIRMRDKIFPEVRGTLSEEEIEKAINSGRE